MKVLESYMSDGLTDSLVLCYFFPHKGSDCINIYICLFYMFPLKQLAVLSSRSQYSQTSNSALKQVQYFPDLMLMGFESHEFLST